MIGTIILSTIEAMISLLGYEVLICRDIIEQNTMWSSLNTAHPFRPLKTYLHPRNSSTRSKKSTKKQKNPQKALSQTTHSKRYPSPRKTPLKQQKKSSTQKGKEKMFMTSSLNLPRMTSISCSESLRMSSQQLNSHEHSDCYLPLAELLDRTKNALKSYEQTTQHLRHRNKEMQRELTQARQKICLLQRRASKRKSREL